MKQEIVEYLRSIGMGDILVAQATAIHDRFIAITGKSIEDALASEYVTEDGQRQYSTLFFFNNTDIFEAENFLSDTPTMWIARLTRNLGYVGLTPKDYDFVTASPASRLNLQCKWVQGTSFVLKAQTSGDNCRRLLGIVRKYLMPNVV